MNMEDVRKETRKRMLIAGAVTSLLLIGMVGIANANYPDSFEAIYDPDSWSLVVDGEGGILFPEDGGWNMDYLFGDSVAPAWPNARIMVENSTGSLFVVYARAHAVGEETRTKICVATSDDFGATWSEQDINEGTVHSLHGMPTVDIDGSGYLHVAWVEYNATEDHSDIRYQNNTDGDWSGTPTNLVQAGWNQTRPAIQVDGNDVAHVVWQSIHMTFNTNTIFAWNSTRTNDTIVGVVGNDSPEEEGADNDYQYPGLAIDVSNEIMVSYHEIDSGTDAYAVGVSVFDNSFTYIASNKTISLKPQSRNPSIGLNETGHILLAYKAYTVGTPGVSAIHLSIQDDSDTLNDWTTVEMAEYPYHGVWLYPSVACSSTDQYLVTSLVSRESSHDITGGMFWGNVSDGALDDSGLIEHPHDYVLYAFSNLKWSSHNNNGQNYGDNTLWVITLGEEDYLDTDIVLMGESIVGEYTHPEDSTPTTPTAHEEMVRKIGDVRFIFYAAIPLMLLLYVLLFMFDIFKKHSRL